MILDGWGIGDGSKADVISQVPTPNITYYKNNYPNTTDFMLQVKMSDCLTDRWEILKWAILILVQEESFIRIL